MHVVNLICGTLFCLMGTFNKVEQCNSTVSVFDFWMTQHCEYLCIHLFTITYFDYYDHYPVVSHLHKGMCTQRPLIYKHHSSVFWLMTGSKHPPKRFLHIVRLRASSFKGEYSLLSLRSSSSFLRLLPCLLVTCISPLIFLSITCFRRQFLRKMWPIQLAFRFLISCRIFLCSLTLSN